MIDQLAAMLQEARTRTLELVQDLTDEQMIGPRLETVNPLRWELGHVGWFQEYWVLRHSRGQQPIQAEGDQLYDSTRIPHDSRWDLPLPSKAETVGYVQRILERVIERQRPGAGHASDEDLYGETYFMRLALFHEYMHAEAMTYTRQTLGYPAPRIGTVPKTNGQTGRIHAAVTDHCLAVPNDAEVPGGEFMLGTFPGEEFVFDNEQWAHPVTLKPFRISRRTVTNGELAAFVEAGGYSRREFWNEEGWRWLEGAKARHPVYWKKEGSGRWLRRDFDQWLSLEERNPALHVNWYEADAYCRWAQRRLPTEAEWEMAASAELRINGHGAARSKRLFPWGDEPPTPKRANLDWRAMGCADADDLPLGDSPFGCRQMIGNVWEWTSTDFGPYPGFAPGPYKEYSEPWFGDHKVLRGGCWATRSALIQNSYRNFYRPHRRDVWAGFRTCAL